MFRICFRDFAVEIIGSEPRRYSYTQDPIAFPAHCWYGAAHRVLSSLLAVTGDEVIFDKMHTIVDDSQPIRTATRHFVERETEFTVCGEAIDGLDAIEKARYLSPDLIILDLSMPRMNGLQAARKLRAMSVEAPIILFTMFADAVRPEESEAAGISVVVSKMDLSALHEHLEKLLVSS